jgi:NADH-quinone oxidoreductase subunit J
VANALFYLMAAVCVLAAVGVVFLRNPIASVLSLLTSFFCLATIYLLAGFQFLAAAQILVYAGAIMVLFLFVILLLNLTKPPPLEAFRFSAANVRRGTFTIAITVALLVLGVVAVVRSGSTAVAAPMPAGGIDRLAPPVASAQSDSTPATTGGLADEMFSRYLLPFEAVSLLLLATAVAVVVLAKRNRPGAREQAP